MCARLGLNQRSGDAKLLTPGVMAAIERRQPFAILHSRCADEGVAKFQTMTPAISTDALPGQLASSRLRLAFPE